MPQLGEIRSSKEVGLKGHAQQIWHACLDCGKERWVQVKKGIRDDNRRENLELSTMGGHSLAHHKGYKDGYDKGLIDGRNKQIEELKKEIRLLQWQIKEYISEDKLKKLEQEVK